MICRYDNSGLGTLSWEFARHLKPHKVLLVQNDIYKTFPERYSDFDTRIHDNKYEDWEWLSDDVDVVFSAETFYNWSFVELCRKKGVKTALYTMFEMQLDPIPLHPTLFICPSKLDMEYYPENKVFLPPPVATDRLIWNKRETAKTFIHSASHTGLKGRKGTQLLIDAINLVKADVQFKIYSWKPFAVSDPRVSVDVVNFKNYWQMWRQGDVLVYPQGANGICLPIIEAMSSGLAVITTDIYPFNEYMPKELLFPPNETFRHRMSPRLNEVEDYRIDPKDIADKIDYIAEKPIDTFSEYGLQWSKQNSWDVLLPKYKEVLNNLC